MSIDLKALCAEHCGWWSTQNSLIEWGDKQEERK
jgi:hypothetical protein